MFPKNKIMKKIVLFLLFTATLISCSNDALEEDNSIVGRWHVVGFEDSVLYEFTNDFRYTIYSSDGTFGNLETAIPNPHSWYFEGDELVIDLNFGNLSTVTPNFKCNGNVVVLMNESGTTTLFKEGYLFSNCNE